MSDVYKNQPAPGASSDEGAYQRNPQQQSYYYQDANQYGADQYAAQIAAPQSSVRDQDRDSEPSVLTSWFNFTDTTYLKGLLLGAGAAFLVTNPRVQQAAVTGAVKLWTAIQGGVEEIKEQVQDVKAEISQQE